MIENLQVQELKKHLRHGMSLSQAALKSGMSEKTARKYRDSKRLPSELSVKRTWRTRKDPFENTWVHVHAWLDANPRLMTTEIFRRLQRDYPKLFSGSVRALQRGVKKWRTSRQNKTPVQSRESGSRQWMHEVFLGAMSRESSFIFPL